MILPCCLYQARTVAFSRYKKLARTGEEALPLRDGEHRLGVRRGVWGDWGFRTSPSP